MSRLVTGSIVAAIAMFILGFIFFASPLKTVAYAHADPAVIARVQAAMAELPVSGTYVIPDAEQPGGAAAYAKGPTGVVEIVKSGAPTFDPLILLKGFGQYFVSVFVVGLALRATAGRLDAGQRRAMLGWTIVGTTIFNELGDPIWDRLDWTNALYVFVANTIILIVGALILARWFIPQPSAQ